MISWQIKFYISHHIFCWSRHCLYGIITAFPYKITSICLKKTRNLQIDNKELSYSQINNKPPFFGYEKKDNFMMAEKEKAVFDYIYLAPKGYAARMCRSLIYQRLTKNRLNDYLVRIKYKI